MPLSHAPCVWLRVKDGACKPRAGLLPQVRPLATSLMAKIRTRPWSPHLVDPIGTGCRLKRHWKGHQMADYKSAPTVYLSSPIELQMATKRTEISLKNFRNSPLDARIKSPLKFISKTHQNAVDLLAKNPKLSAPILYPIFGHLTANQRPRLGLQASPRRIAPLLGHPRLSHHRKWWPRAVEGGGHFFCVHTAGFQNCTLAPQILLFSCWPFSRHAWPIQLYH